MKCYICFFEKKNYIILECNHEMCYCCLKKIKKDGEIKCPFCRKDIILENAVDFDGKKLNVSILNNDRILTIKYEDEDNYIKYLKELKISKSNLKNKNNKCCLINN